MSWGLASMLQQWLAAWFLLSAVTVVTAKSAADYFVASLPGQPDGTSRSPQNTTETSSSGTSRIVILPIAKGPYYGSMAGRDAVRWTVH
ncbi:MAG: hypothetical protein LQ341_006208 [Variospora aurantia]|nr:MAG: hypothetical protein LQ341_006208 [Variospora aurantia]